MSTTTQSTAPEKIKAKGMLRHHFWGHYVADVILGFNSADDARKAIEKLELKKPGHYRDASGNDGKSEWHMHSKDTRAILITASGETLAEVQALLESFGADKKKMNSMKTSVDFGEQFEIEIPV